MRSALAVASVRAVGGHPAGDGAVVVLAALARDAVAVVVDNNTMTIDVACPQGAVP